jgi:hypothetical protein
MQAYIDTITPFIKKGNLIVIANPKMLQLVKNQEFKDLILSNKIVVILDLPEAGKNIEWQINHIRTQIKTLNHCKKNFCWILITNSDDIIRQINIAIMLGSTRLRKKKAAIMEQYGLEKNETIHYSRVFAFEGEGETLTQIEVEETGFSVASMDIPICRQNEMADAVYFTLYD